MSQARFTNVQDVPLALAVFLASDYYDYSNDPDEVSATALLKPLRQIVLTPRVPAGQGLVPLAGVMSNRLGAAIHDGIEKAWLHNHIAAMQALGLPAGVIRRVVVNPPPGTDLTDLIPVYLEQRLKRRLGKYIITGKFDFVGEGAVQDFKTTGTFTYKKQTNAEKWTLQGSIYRWLDPKLITSDELQIHYIFTDWKSGFVGRDPNYPPKQFITQRYPLLSLQETERFITNKLALVEQHINTPEADLPECPDEDLWRSDPQFKYYADAANAYTPGKRSTKNFDSRQEAMIFMHEKGGKGAIKEVLGEVKACRYCPAFSVCTQKDRLIAAGDLQM